MRPKRAERPAATTIDAAMATIAAALDELLGQGRPIRLDLPDGSRLHMDRPLPFLWVKVGIDNSAAFDVVSANAAYLTAADTRLAEAVVAHLAPRLAERTGAFLLLDVDELAEDRFLTPDAPFLPPFEIALASGESAPERAALKRFSEAAASRKSRYRTPRVCDLPPPRSHLRRDIARLWVRFAPIYKAAGGKTIYPGLRDQVVANMIDSGLQAVGAFLKASKVAAPPSHRALGRRAFIEAVGRADRGLDKVASSFDFLLALTPINSEAAWAEFKAHDFKAAPTFLYRPLEIEVGAEKRKLYAVSLDHLEDPLLRDLLSEKQQELDLQLSLLAARETPRFAPLGRALYGGVEPSLKARAETILKAAVADGAASGPSLGAETVAAAAREMIAGYRSVFRDFDASVEIRSDLPPGLLVSNGRLLIARDTQVARDRLPALLSHEIGVHLLTYFNGAVQGLTILRSGLAGYEATQEGLAVLAEYLVGGMTAQRLRLLAARVIASHAMLEGAAFVETFAMLCDSYALSARTAFNIALRVYRGGGLAKDAIYLRGVSQVLAHLRRGGSLTPFWVGKISATHFDAIEELRARDLLRPPQLEPAFLSAEAARPRLKKAIAGIEPLDMISN